MVQWYIKRGTSLEDLEESMRKHFTTLAENIGQELLARLNPDLELWRKLKKEDTVVFDIGIVQGSIKGGRFGTAHYSVNATANVNGSKDLLFPFKIDINFSPFNFEEYQRNELKNKIQKLSHDFQDRIRRLPENFKNNNTENDKIRNVVQLLINYLQIIINGTYVSIEDAEYAIDYIEKNLLALEKLN
jgi:hypothetical protein